eukprot:8703115-Ditylum_brightwellii.AAC.1
MWKPGEGNLADYSTKHSPPSHHKKVCRTYLVKEKLDAVLWYQTPRTLGGCAGIPGSRILGLMTQ